MSWRQSFAMVSGCLPLPVRRRSRAAGSVACSSCFVDWKRTHSKSPLMICKGLLPNGYAQYPSNTGAPSWGSAKEIPQPLRCQEACGIHLIVEVVAQKMASGGVPHPPAHHRNRLHGHCRRPVRPVQGLGRLGERPSNDCRSGNPMHRGPGHMR